MTGLRFPWRNSGLSGSFSSFLCGGPTWRFEKQKAVQRPQSEGHEESSPDAPRSLRPPIDRVGVPEAGENVSFPGTQYSMCISLEVCSIGRGN